MLIPLGDVPSWHADRNHENAVAIIHQDVVLSWRDLESRANRRARAMRQAGVRPGDFVAIILPNGNEFFEFTFATWKAGATPCPLSHRLPRNEAVAILDLLKPSLIVGGNPDWGLQGSVSASFGADGYSDEALHLPTARYWKAIASGGSTGRPKIVVDHMPAAVEPKAQPLFMHELVRTLNPGPLYHNAPFTFSHNTLVAGGLLVGMPKFDGLEAMRLIRDHRIEWVNFVPTMMSRILSLPRQQREAIDMSSLQVVFHMAAPMPPWLKEAWIEWLGPDRIFELYGGTERQAATVISGVEWLTHKGSVGRMEVGDVKVLNDSGEPLRAGEIGELYLRSAEGPGTTYHYIGAEPKSAPGGWESLGDIGYVDADGYVWLTDRRTDMILRGGANIYPAEVEAALLAYPSIRSCAVIGLPDPDLGNRIHAVLELTPDALAESLAHELPEFLLQHISRPKHPQSYEIVENAVRDDAGKVRRTALRDERIGWRKEGRSFEIPLILNAT
ncbi:AMP-binding protein [Bradyrhizobium sp.]|uniref:AMP-binding protein n=1 Tax=Bradyrhizobium sp. TaxID=376 RepID=UPI0039E23D1B